MQSIRQPKQNQEIEFLSCREVLSVLKIDSSMLWGWEKMGHIRSFPFGGRKRYKLADVEAIPQAGKCGTNFETPGV